VAEAGGFIVQSQLGLHSKILPQKKKKERKRKNKTPHCSFTILFFLNFKIWVRGWPELSISQNDLFWFNGYLNQK
jgi:hypothetical protein